MVNVFHHSDLSLVEYDLLEIKLFDESLVVRLYHWLSDSSKKNIQELYEYQLPVSQMSFQQQLRKKKAVFQL